MTFERIMHDNMCFVQSFNPRDTVCQLRELINSGEINPSEYTRASLKISALSPLAFGKKVNGESYRILFNGVKTGKEMVDYTAVIECMKLMGFAIRPETERRIRCAVPSEPIYFDKKVS